MHKETLMDYYTVLHTCGLRYSDMLKHELQHCSCMPDDWQLSIKELEPFIEQFIHGCESGMPLNKLNRWLGYIQGTLIALDITSVDTERDWTRPLFRPLDYAN